MPNAVTESGTDSGYSVAITAALLRSPDSKSITSLDPCHLLHTLYASAEAALEERGPRDAFEALFSIYLETAQENQSWQEPEIETLMVFVFSFSWASGYVAHLSGI